MLVKVNDSYKGVFGLYIEKYHSVEAKRAGDPPFELAEDVAHAQIRNGVLSPAEACETEELPEEDEAAVEDPEPDTSEPEASEPEESEPDNEYDEMSYRELVAACKERGISYKNKKTDELKEILKESEDTEDAPELEAEDPI